MKKSQMEILGLVVVILLIMVGLLLFIRFRIGGPANQNLKMDFENSQITKNYLNAYLYVTTSCNRLQIINLAKECAAMKGTVAFGTTVRCSNGDPCKEMLDIAKTTSEDVFDGYNYRISFSTVRGGTVTEIFNVTSPDYDSNAKNKPGSATQPLPSKEPGKMLQFKVDITE